jgi:hypothetical protein
MAILNRVGQVFEALGLTNRRLAEFNRGLAAIETRLAAIETKQRDALARMIHNAEQQLLLLEDLQDKLVPKPAATLELIAGAVEEQD